jgi:hypothetical protein
MRLAQATLLLLVGAALPARAQVTTTAAAEARQRPGGQVLASVPTGARVTPAGTSGDATFVVLEGWVEADRLGAARDSFEVTVSGRITLRMRTQASPSADIVAVLQPGTGLHTVSRQGTWARVRRALWVPSSAVAAAPTAATPAAPAAASTGSAAAPGRTAAPASAPPAERPAAPVGGAAPGKDRAMVGATGTRVMDLPQGVSFGGIAPGTVVDVIGRQPGWVRVRLDGWVEDKDLTSADSAATPRIRAADLRADPQGMRGQVVQWEVEVMAFQEADPLRVELTPGEPYLLARGPGTENVVLYLAIPRTLLAEARAIPPLTRIAITAKVRSGRSEPAGTPILDLQTITRR